MIMLFKVRFSDSMIQVIQSMIKRFKVYAWNDSNYYAKYDSMIESIHCMVQWFKDSRYSKYDSMTLYCNWYYLMAKPSR